jgi:hypothetical protein
MTWIKTKVSSAGTTAAPTWKNVAKPPRVDSETERKLADFLVTHGRLVVRTGRPTLHFLGTCANHDGTHDYAVRTHVREQDGKHVTYDSTIRKYESGHLRLVR